MPDIVKIINVDDIKSISEKIKYRQDTFLNEDFIMSVGVVLMNYGDKYVLVSCIKGEWSGTKEELYPREGVPLCPNGHPLFEISTAPKLALIIEEMPNA